MQTVGDLLSTLIDSRRQEAATREVEARLSDADSGEFDSIRTGASNAEGASSGTATVALLAEAYDLDSRLHPADAEHFLSEACRTPGKPVNFVPVIDAEVRRCIAQTSGSSAFSTATPSAGSASTNSPLAWAIAG